MAGGRGRQRHRRWATHALAANSAGAESVSHARFWMTAGSGGQSATPEEIREFCKGQIAPDRIPRYTEFAPVFPMTITGKIQKFVMRERTIAKLGLKAGKTA